MSRSRRGDLNIKLANSSCMQNGKTNTAKMAAAVCIYMAPLSRGSYCFLLCDEACRNNSSCRALPEGTGFAITGGGRGEGEERGEEQCHFGVAVICHPRV